VTFAFIRSCINPVVEGVPLIHCRFFSGLNKGADAALACLSLINIKNSSKYE